MTNRPMADRIIGIAGRPGSGKTSLMVGLVGELSRRGLTVSTIMAADAEGAIDQPGKDSFRHRDAGADEVMVTSAQRWALIHGGREKSSDPAGLMTAVHMVITEGMDHSGYPMIEVYRGETSAGEAPLGQNDPAILAVVSDVALEGIDKPVIDLADLPAVADFIVARMGLAGDL